MTMDKTDEFYTARGYEMSRKQHRLTASMEDYIEMIYRLSVKSGYTRVNDLAEKLNVQPPSVTKMMQKLHEKGLLDYQKYGMIHLTSEGIRLGKYFLERHNIVKEFLAILGANDNLQKDVEGIEHFLSWSNYQILAAFLQYLKENQDFIENFAQYRNRWLAEEVKKELHTQNKYFEK
ncbi:iron dependent repressor [Alkaliphilus metalliredigens QYMF]|uniref:Manganese transport regulator n=1 Tax=Alkaliphilus metalliredigens (strain QYMF) TaxID=293826 RepID=A6TNQ2_ALKMQ|nr:transcriptional regulator MntR [Alkaliphilus metalliredigens]ABR47820.1 iron dependent repressor [Alkaliphilus metalliredigens QYMF]